MAYDFMEYNKFNGCDSSNLSTLEELEVQEI